MGKCEILKDVDLGPGCVLFDDLSVDFSRPLHEQLDLLKEDLLQIQFPEEVLLDVGWYPSFQATGQFQVRVVQAGEWDPPFTLVSARDWDTLRRCIQASVATALALSGARQNSS